MGVYIKGIEKPKHCQICAFLDEMADKCRIHEINYRSWNEEYDNCPLIPVPDIEPKKWKWIDHTCINWHGYHCSVCDYETQRKTPFCPNCGARMDVDNFEQTGTRGG